MSKDYTFNPGDFVVYPAHGVGQVLDLETTSVAGQSMNLIAVNFAKDKLTVRIPTTDAEKKGLRQVSNEQDMNAIVQVLYTKPKAKRVQWAKRSQEYTNKINSGDTVAVAEVVRDLYKNPSLATQTYSERQIYEKAMGRLSSEYAVVHGVTEEQAVVQLETVLYEKTSKGVLK